MFDNVKNVHNGKGSHILENSINMILVLLGKDVEEESFEKKWIFGKYLAST